MIIPTPNLTLLPSSIIGKIYQPIYNSFRLTQLAAATILSACPALADELIVTIDNIKEAGEIHVAVYGNAAALEADHRVKSGAAPGIMQGIIEYIDPDAVTYHYEVAPGIYAICIFHHANLDNRLDNHFFSVPREQYGFSNNARGFMGSSSFDDAAFTVEGKSRFPSRCKHFRQGRWRAHSGQFFL